MPVFALIVAFILTSIAVPLIIRAAKHYRAYDKPDSTVDPSGTSAVIGRKVHEVPIPRLGGLGFVLSFLVTYFVFAPRSSYDAIVLTSFAVFLIGFADDLYHLSAKLRLVGQIAVSVFVVWYSDLSVPSVYFSQDSFITLSPVIAFSFSIFILVGAMNAFNMIDGMDGQASLCGIIAILTLSVIIVTFTGDVGLFVYVAGPLIGALLGFLRSNVHPADIFMGDGGSNWLGFNVGVLLLLFLAQKSGFYEVPFGLQGSVVGISGRLPILVFALLCTAVPIVDAASVMLSRVARKQNPMTADRRHIHHTLLNLGLGHGAVVSVVGLTSGFLGLLGVTLCILAPNLWVTTLGYVAFFGIFLVVLAFANEWLPVVYLNSSVKPSPQSKPMLLKPNMRLLGSRPIRFISVVSADILAVSAGLYLAFLFRLDFFISPSFLELFKKLCPLAIMSHIMISLAFRQYQQIYRYATLGTILQLFRTHFLAFVLFSVTVYFSGIGPFIPKSIILMQFMITLAFSGTLRFIPRMARAGGYFVQERTRPRCLVYGAGAAGELLARQMQYERNFPYILTGFIDDDSRKQGKFLHGFRILGKGSDLAEICERYSIQNIVVAMHSLDGVSLRDIVKKCQQAGVTPLLMPDLKKGIDPKAIVPRPVDVKDLLQRTPKAINRPLIQSLLEDKVIVVTGAGGSIGSEICRQLCEIKPRKLLMIDASEYNLYAIHTELLDHGISPEVVIPLLGSVTDARFVNDVFKKFEPKFIFHAAAYKHVHLVESNPTEAILNNVLGTKTMAQAAIEHKAERFLLISTDKAVRPTSVMGATKRCCELLVQCLQAKPDNHTSFAAVRFGNVLGSSGSVVPRFMEQIKNGGPVTVTHPEVTRYFMLISEAVALVLQSIVMTKGGEVFVLNMGESIKIYDMACQLIRLVGREPGRDIEIVFTGLKPGEKLYEELLLEGHEAKTDHDDVFELLGGVKDSKQTAQNIDDILLQAKEGRSAESLHGLWSIVKHGGGILSATNAKSKVDQNATLN